MFRNAVAEGVVTVNPCTLLPGDLPAKKDKDPKWRKTARFTRDELRALVLDERNPADRRAFWAIMFLGATRFGEAAALRWGAYDDTTVPLGKLTIEVSYSTKKKSEKETKTEVPREMPVHPLLAAVLAEWKAHGWREMMGREPRPEDLIVPSREGRNRNVNHMLRRFKQDCERMELRTRRQHDTRRTFISLAREGGAGDLLKWCTHGAPGEIIDQYTTPSWEKLCAEVLCVELDDDPQKPTSDWATNWANRSQAPDITAGRTGLEAVHNTSTRGNCTTLDETQASRVELSARTQVATGPVDPTDLARLAAKARIVESLSSGDVRVLAAELRAALERLSGHTADVLSIARGRTKG